MMKYAQLIKIYRAINLIIWFIMGTWGMVVLVTLIETDCAHAPNDATRVTTGAGQRIQQTERNAVLPTAVGAQAESI